MTKLILIRGLPGSGKTTLAKSIYRPGASTHLEADQYFVSDEGDYIFDATKLHAAHLSCQDDTRFYLEKGDTVIVANTFTTLKELKPYFKIAKEFGIVPIVYHCQNTFESVHDVPAETIERMKARWAHDITPLYES